ncbi:MAG: hypothetical protein IGS03_17235 [Candidatus Sericytochromatia bacterium]|nr:hypothetical protein [Candidatus Sericytochromatia bacterium]
MALNSGCLQRQSQPESLPDKVRIVRRLPQGIHCEPLATVTLRDGQGCAYMGRTQPGSPDILMHNLRLQARKYGANVALLLSDIEPDSWEGCPANGLMIESELYRCTFGLVSDKN